MLVIVGEHGSPEGGRRTIEEEAAVEEGVGVRGSCVVGHGRAVF